LVKTSFLICLIVDPDGVYTKRSVVVETVDVFKWDTEPDADATVRRYNVPNTAEKIVKIFFLTVVKYVINIWIDLHFKVVTVWEMIGVHSPH